MSRASYCLMAAAIILVSARTLAGEVAPARSPRQALQPFNMLIGSWRGVGAPEGTQAQKRLGFWSETIKWEWQFKNDDAWLRVIFDKGKHFLHGSLRYLPDTDQFQLTLVTVGKDAQVFSGGFQDQVLTLERTDAQKKEVQRLVISLLHSNRFLYRYEVKAQDRGAFRRLYQVGATKEGVAFAEKGDHSPECIVTGGLGTLKLAYKGKDYYFCCTGCRDAFKDDPEKYIREYREKQKK